jgi:hypothetical protein
MSTLAWRKLFAAHSPGRRAMLEPAREKETPE